MKPKSLEPLKALLRPLALPLLQASYDLQWFGSLKQLRADRFQRGDSIRVSYGHAGFPKPVAGQSVVIGGGAVKYGYLARHIPHAGLQTHILYVVSSSHSPYLTALLDRARACGIKVVWNQNGVAYPAWHGPGWEQKNLVIAYGHRVADYVVYQSNFARLSSERFLGRRTGPSEVLYNAVDTTFFAPADTPPRPGKDLILLIAGSHESWYRLPIALQTVALVARQYPDVRLLVAGRLSLSVMAELQRLVAELAIADRVEVVGPYTQEVAPQIFQRAHILLHTQYNDVCPTVVIEAIACGLPVVYSRSGGTPELVGTDAGYGVDSALSWDELKPPQPEALAEGVLTVAERWETYHTAARARATEYLDVTSWIKRHQEIFEAMVG